MTFTLGTPSRPAPKAETLAWAAAARRALMQRGAARLIATPADRTAIGGFRSSTKGAENLVRIARV